MTLTTTYAILGIVGVLATVGAFLYARMQVGAQTVDESRASFVATRDRLNASRADLEKFVISKYPESIRGLDCGLLTQDAWLPPRPLLATDIGLNLKSCEPEPLVLPAETRRALEAVLPLQDRRRRFARYSAAVEALTPPAMFVDRKSYRLLELDLCSATPFASFGMTTYFTMFDLAESLAHEAVLACPTVTTDAVGVHRRLRRAVSRGDMPLRQSIDPASLHTRHVLPSINTLTIRNGENGPTFFMHYRDPKQVAIAGGIFHVVPCGVFQPAAITPMAIERDLDLWKNALREYAEELLGVEEATGDAGISLDYSQQAPYSEFEHERTRGGLVFKVLGFGLDPLTLCGEFLTVTVFQASSFDRLFPDLAHGNLEGTIVGDRSDGEHVVGIPFTETEVYRFLREGPLSPAAGGCLELAWRYRDNLLIAPN